MADADRFKTAVGGDAAAAIDGDSPEIERAILPEDANPLEYILELYPNLDSCLFSGKLEVSYNVEIATDEIHLHSRELNFREASWQIKDDSGVVTKTIDSEEINFKKKETVVIIKFAEVLPTGTNGSLLIPRFDGVLNDQMAGFYRSEYVDKNDKKRRLAVSQFEPIDARRCFPCVDEPGKKAIFTVSIICKKEYQALSNMPIKSQTALDHITDDGGLLNNGFGTKMVGYVKNDFFPSAKMSTYLLAFMVGEFDHIAGVTKNGTTIRCLSVPGKADQLAFSLDVGIKCLDFYNDFFGTPYPLPKCDMAAIPDFAAGAMENWGLITYREIDLLCNVAQTSTARKQRVASVVTHELAHQWFGNLVTMEWWNDLWLNEGFANFMQTYSADAIFPEWKLWENFVAEDQAAALRLDSLRSSHPIQVPIPKAEQVEEIFDAISYCKGGSCVRMLFATLGEEHFQLGLQNYMEKYSYANTQTFDLWRCWEEVSGKPISAMMKAWTEQMGYPVLTVDKVDDSTISVSQRWYLADNSVEEGDEEKVWTVPMLLATNNGYDKEVQFLGEKEQQFKLPGGSKYVKVNAGQFVPMRVAYSENMLKDLSEALKESEEAGGMCAEDRIGFLLDTYALCQSGHLENVESVFHVLKGYANESNPNVWDAVKMVVDALDKVMSELTDVYPEFKKFVSKMITEPFKKLGWDNQEGDSDLIKHQRGMMIAMMANYNDTDAELKAEAKRRYTAFVEDQNTTVLPDDYKGPVFKLMVKDPVEGTEVWEQLVKIMKDPKTAQAHRLTIYGVLGYNPSLEYKKRALEETFEIKLQDFFYPMSGVAASGKEGNKLIFDWMRSEWPRIKARVAKASGSLLQHVVAVSCSGTTFERAEQTLEFFADKTEPSIARTLKQVTEKTRVNARFLDLVQKSNVKEIGFWQAL